MTRLEELQGAVIKPADYQVPLDRQTKPVFKITLGHWLLVILAFLCLLFIAFVTFARSVEVVTYAADVNKPESRIQQPAKIVIDTWLKLPIGNRVMVLPGDYQFSATASGYVEVNDTLKVQGERSQQFEVILEPLPGILDIQVEPAVAATVSLDDQIIGELPGLIKDVPFGSHKITIDAPLYRELSQQLLIVGKGQTQSLSVNLQPAWAEISINSLPVSANVIVDELEYGVTPLAFKLEEGNRHLVLQAEGFKPYEADIIVVAEQNLIMPEVQLKPADAVLQVQTSPDSAAVILNDEFVGVSPITLNLEPENQHKLRLYKAGYQFYDEQIVLQAAESQTTEVQLQADLVPVKLSVSPVDAEIFVNGQSRGKGSQTLYLSTLEHNITVSKSGYTSHQSQIIPTKANEQIVSIKLKTKEEQFWTDVPRKYATSLGQNMILFTPPGKVLMGSSRGEAGRRENEVQYTATLTKHFYVSEKEVTNKEFRQFDPAHNAGNYKRKSLDSNTHPAVNISWQRAALYCNWLSEKEGLDPFYQTKSGYVSGQNPTANGYRLPTEVEWAWLARNKGDNVMVYPWGNQQAIGSNTAVGNFADKNAQELVAFTLEDYDDGYIGTSPVGRYAQNHRGLYDLEGNASEWLNDWYAARGNLELSSSDADLIDPLGPEIGEFHVIRGASWAKGYLPQLRLAYRDFGAKGKHDVGFRLARYVIPPE